MSRHVPVIASDESGVVGGRADISPGAARNLQNLLVGCDWRGQLRRMGLAPADAASVEQAVAALFVAGSQRSVTSAGGSAERHGSVPLPESVTWTTEQAAAVLGCTPRWVRRLAQEDMIESERAGRSLRLDASSVAAYAARRAACE